jgi:membrane associated rhomboid family serine protease
MSVIPIGDGVPTRRFPAYLILYPGSRVLSLIGIFPIKVPAWLYLGLWFLYQLVAGNFGIFSTTADGGGVAFFAHVGGFLFGFLTIRLLKVRDPAPRVRRGG